MSQKVRAIVIKSENLKDKDASVLLFSLEEGKIWAKVKGVKNPKSKLRFAKELFSFGEFLLEEGKAGMIVTGFDCIETFHEITADINKFCEACGILQTLTKLEFSTEIERAQVFMLTINCLKILCFKNAKNLSVLCKFLIEIFKIFGFPLYSDHCSGCKSKVFDSLYINYLTGELVCVACKTFSSEKLSNAVLSALKILTFTDVERLETLKLAQLDELLGVLTRNFETRFDCKLSFVGILD